MLKYTLRICWVIPSSFEFGYVQSFEVEGLIHILNLQGAYAILLTEGNLM